MFDGIKDQWNNRSVRCLKCQKKLVGKEKWVCKKCRTDMTEGAVAILVISALTGIGIHSQSKKS